MDQARAIGLATKDNWKNYPEDVCYWRTIDRVLHVAFADVCMGLYAADELGMDITPDGEVVESQWAPVEPEPVLAFSTIDALLTQWTAEQIVVANEGKIPSTVDECQQVTEILNG